MESNSKSDMKVDDIDPCKLAYQDGRAVLHLLKGLPARQLNIKTSYSIIASGRISLPPLICTHCTEAVEDCLRDSRSRSGSTHNRFKCARCAMHNLTCNIAPDGVVLMLNNAANDDVVNAIFAPKGKWMVMSRVLPMREKVGSMRGLVEKIKPFDLDLKDWEHLCKDVTDVDADSKSDDEEIPSSSPSPKAKPLPLPAAASAQPRTFFPSFPYPQYRIPNPEENPTPRVQQPRPQPGPQNHVPHPPGEIPPHLLDPQLLQQPESIVGPSSRPAITRPGPTLEQATNDPHTPRVGVHAAPGPSRTKNGSHPSSSPRRQQTHAGPTGSTFGGYYAPPGEATRRTRVDLGRDVVAAREGSRDSGLGRSGSREVRMGVDGSRNRIEVDGRREVEERRNGSDGGARPVAQPRGTEKRETSTRNPTSREIPPTRTSGGEMFPRGAVQGRPPIQQPRTTEIRQTSTRNPAPRDTPASRTSGGEMFPWGAVEGRPPITQSQPTANRETSTGNPAPRDTPATRSNGGEMFPRAAVQGQQHIPQQPIPQPRPTEDRGPSASNPAPPATARVAGNGVLQGWNPYKPVYEPRSIFNVMVRGYEPGTQPPAGAAAVPQGAGGGGGSRAGDPGAAPGGRVGLQSLLNPVEGGSRSEGGPARVLGAVGGEAVERTPFAPPRVVAPSTVSRDPVPTARTFSHSNNTNTVGPTTQPKDSEPVKIQKPGNDASTAEAGDGSDVSESDGQSACGDRPNGSRNIDTRLSAKDKGKGKAPIVLRTTDKPVAGASRAGSNASDSDSEPEGGEYQPDEAADEVQTEDGDEEENLGWNVRTRRGAIANKQLQNGDDESEQSSAEESGSEEEDDEEPEATTAPRDDDLEEEDELEDSDDESESEEEEEPQPNPTSMKPAAKRNTGGTRQVLPVAKSMAMEPRGSGMIDKHVEMPRKDVGGRSSGGSVQPQTAKKPTHNPGRNLRSSKPQPEKTSRPRTRSNTATRPTTRSSIGAGPSTPIKERLRSKPSSTGSKVTRPRKQQGKSPAAQEAESSKSGTDEGRPSVPRDPSSYPHPFPPQSNAEFSFRHRLPGLAGSRAHPDHPFHRGEVEYPPTRMGPSSTARNGVSFSGDANVPIAGSTNTGPSSSTGRTNAPIVIPGSDDTTSNRPITGRTSSGRAPPLTTTADPAVPGPKSNSPQPSNPESRLSSLSATPEQEPVPPRIPDKTAPSAKPKSAGAKAATPVVPVRQRVTMGNTANGSTSSTAAAMPQSTAPGVQTRELQKSATGKKAPGTNANDISGHEDSGMEEMNLSGSKRSSLNVLEPSAVIEPDDSTNVAESVNGPSGPEMEMMEMDEAMEEDIPTPSRRKSKLPEIVSSPTAPKSSDQNMEDPNTDTNIARGSGTGVPAPGSSSSTGAGITVNQPVQEGSKGVKRTHEDSDDEDEQPRVKRPRGKEQARGTATPTPRTETPRTTIKTVPTPNQTQVAPSTTGTERSPATSVPIPPPPPPPGPQDPLPKVEEPQPIIWTAMLRDPSNGRLRTVETDSDLAVWKYLMRYPGAQAGSQGAAVEGEDGTVEGVEFVEGVDTQGREREVWEAVLRREVVRGVMEAQEEEERVEREREAAVLAAEEAERERVAEEERVERERVADAERLEREREAAVLAVEEAERARIAAQERVERERVAEEERVERARLEAREQERSARTAVREREMRERAEARVRRERERVEAAKREEREREEEEEMEDAEEILDEMGENDEE